MSTEEETKQDDGRFFNKSSEGYIPIACYYDKETLLTKSGELIKTIQINGINAEEISKELFNLRSVVRSAIQNNLNTENIAIWVHTVRRRANLDDSTPYTNPLASFVHQRWCEKNYWRDKFVNRLYVSFVYGASTLKVKNYSTFVSTMMPGIVSKFEERYLASTAKVLTDIVDKVCSQLEDFGVRRLGIRYENNKCYSDALFLYSRILHLDENPVELPLSDLSCYLSEKEVYAIGSDKMEVMVNDKHRFASILSLKEYQEMDIDLLDSFMQIPVEMIITEIFYPTADNKSTNMYKDQLKMAKVSRNERIVRARGLDKLEANQAFCQQQITVMIMGSTLAKLDAKVSKASAQLAEIGIVHVKEDINLEKCYWAQLPANFTFLTRMQSAFLKHSAAFASLHNFPTGAQYCSWGRALTILRTAKGTPYFMNLEAPNGRRDFYIFGGNGSGKSTLANFLLSEADKFKPTSLYITSDMSSGLYIKAKDGRWFQRREGIINPLNLPDTDENNEFIADFIRIIAGHYIKPFTDGETKMLRLLVKQIKAIKPEARSLSKIISSIKPSDKGGQMLSQRLASFTPNGEYYGIFERDETLSFDKETITAFNLEFLSDELFIKKRFPKQKKLIDKFYFDLNMMRSVKAGITYSIFHHFTEQMQNVRKIVVLDNLHANLHYLYFDSIRHKIANKINDNDGALIATISMKTLTELQEQEKNFAKFTDYGTMVVLAQEAKIDNIEKILDITPEESNKLATFTVASRLFLFKNNEHSMALELSIGGLPELTRIFSSGNLEIAAYKEIIKRYNQEDVNAWLPPLLEKLSQV